MTRDGVVFQKPFKRKILQSKGQKFVSRALTEREKNIAKEHLNLLKKLVQGKKKI